MNSSYLYTIFTGPKAIYLFFQNICLLKPIEYGRLRIFDEFTNVIVEMG